MESLENGFYGSSILSKSSSNKLKILFYISLFSSKFRSLRFAFTIFFVSFISYVLPWIIDPYFEELNALPNEFAARVLLCLLFKF